MTEHSPRRRRRHTPRGFWSLLRSPSGMMDLGSITVGVVVVAVLTLATSAMVLGVIPWAQNNGTQQMIASISSAQNVAVNKGGKFLDANGLMAGGYIQTVSGIASGTNGQGDCFVTVAKSDSDKVYYNTNKATESQELTATTKLPCVTGRELQSLVDASGATLAITPETYYAYGFGANDLGQTGTGNATGVDLPNPTTIPTTAMTAPNVITSVSAGPAHACAATAASKIYCWGQGTYYRVGQSTTTNELDPIAVTDTLLAGKDITTLSSGDMHNCVVADAQAYCWGGNTWGQLGNNSTTHSGRTVLVPGLVGKTVTGISAGYASTCAVVAATEAWCWGDNSSGRLGTGNTTSSLVPVKLAGLLAGKKVSEVAVGRNQACAVANGDVYCWGENGNGQLGNGNTTDSLSPVKVTGLPAGKPATSLTAGTTHNCATVDSIVYCWGGNSAGQLGIGTNVDSLQAMPVNGLLRGKTVTMVSAGLDNSLTGASHTCALAADTVYCWGENVNGELGTGTTTGYNVPVAAKSVAKKMTAIAAGGGHTITIGIPIVP